MLKKIKNLLITLLVSLNLISCATVKCSCETSEFNLFDLHNKTILPTKSFVKLDSLADITGAEEDGLVPFSSASGFFIAENKILTAAHFCVSLRIKLFFTEKGNTVNGIYYTMITFDNNKREVIPIKIDEKNDICLMQVIGPVNDIDKQIIKISDSSPNIGDKVFNFAAPLGIFAPGMLPIFEGFYSGGAINPYGQKVDLYTIPIKQGSSGSPILNCKGELIGIVISGIREFSHLGFSPKYETIKKFLE